MILDKILDKLEKDMRDGTKFCGKPIDIEHFLKLLVKADKISFGEIILEKETEEDKHGYRIPKLEDDEKEWWKEGLIPLPSDICWYEFSLDKINQGVLIVQKDGDPSTIECQCVDLYKHKTSLITGAWFREGRNGFIDILTTDAPNSLDEKTLNTFNKMFGHSITLMKYFTLMLNSKSTDIMKATIKPEQQRLRRLLNRRPLSDHRIVTITPQRFIDEAVKEGRGTHASPRLHSRRSHVRTIHKGEPNEKKILIARMWIGKRELGTITKEYKVKIT